MLVIEIKSCLILKIDGVVLLKLVEMLVGVMRTQNWSDSSKKRNVVSRNEELLKCLDGGGSGFVFGEEGGGGEGEGEGGGVKNGRASGNDQISITNSSSNNSNNVFVISAAMSAVEARLKRQLESQQRPNSMHLNTITNMNMNTSSDDLVTLGSTTGSTTKSSSNGNAGNNNANNSASHKVYFEKFSVSPVEIQLSFNITPKSSVDVKRRIGALLSESKLVSLLGFIHIAR